MKAGMAMGQKLAAMLLFVPDECLKDKTTRRVGGYFVARIQAETPEQLQEALSKGTWGSLVADTFADIPELRRYGYSLVGASYDLELALKHYQDKVSGLALETARQIILGGGDNAVSKG